MSLVPGNQCVLGNLTVAGAITSFSNNISTDPFGDLRVSQKHSVIDIKSIFSLSSLRDAYPVTGTGTVTCPLGGPEFKLQTVATNDTAQLTSQQRGVYIAGFGAECGVACRIPVALTGNQIARWGYFDTTGTAPNQVPNNGFYFLYNSSGINVAVVRNGVETIFPRASWNVDTMDGTGPSGLTLDIARGNVFQQVFSWYGFGAIAFRIVATDSAGNQVVQVVHRWAPSGQTSVANPNLNISVLLKNGGTAGTNAVYIAGRQFSTLGNPSQRTNDRLTSAYNLGTSGVANGNVNATFVPILSVTRKTGYLGVPIQIVAVDIITSIDIMYQIRVSPTLSGAFFTAIPDTQPAETALQQDITATSIGTGTTGGIVVYTGMVAGANRASGFGTNSFEISYIMEETQIITLCVRGVTATGGTVASVMRVNEMW
jgi:hypothetical protein